MTPQEEILQKHVDEALTQGEQGKISLCCAALREVAEIISKEPMLLWDTPSIVPLSKASLLILIYDIIDNEEQEIWIGHLNYIYTTQAYHLAKAQNATHNELFDIIKTRLMLLHSYDDFFAETVQYFFFRDEKPQSIEEAHKRRLYALNRIYLMQLDDIRTLETYNKELKSEAVLLEIENKLITENPDFTDDDFKQATVLHDTLFKYSAYKAKTSRQLF